MDNFIKLLGISIIVILIIQILVKLPFKSAIYKGPKEEVYVYIIENTHLHDTKIGISNNPEKRIKQLQTGSSRPLIIRYAIRFNNRDEAIKVENALHKKYSRYKLIGEWFDIDYNQVVKYIEDKFNIK